MNLLAIYFYICAAYFLSVDLYKEDGISNIIILGLMMVAIYTMIEGVQKVKKQKHKIHRMNLVGVCFLFICVIVMKSIEFMVVSSFIKEVELTQFIIETIFIVLVVWYLFLSQVFMVIGKTGINFFCALLLAIYEFAFGYLQIDISVMYFKEALLFVLVVGQIVVLSKCGIDLIGWIKKTNFSDFKMLEDVLSELLENIVLLISNFAVIVILVHIFTSVNGIKENIMMALGIGGLVVPTMYIIYTKEIRSFFDLEVLDLVQILGINLLQTLGVYTVLLKFNEQLGFNILFKEKMYLWFIGIAAYILVINTGQVLKKVGEKRIVMWTELFFKNAVLVIFFFCAEMRVFEKENAMFLSVFALMMIYLPKVVIKFKKEYEKMYY